MTITEVKNDVKPLAPQSRVPIDKTTRHAPSRPTVANGSSRVRRAPRAPHCPGSSGDEAERSSKISNRDQSHDTEETRRQMAMALGFLTEQQVADLAIIKLSTLGEWRKRGEGPMYSRFGNAFLYHSKSVQEFLIAKQHEPSRSWVSV